MNAGSQFRQSAIPNRHTACGPAKKTAVRRKKELLLAQSAIWQSNIAEVHAWRSDTVTDQRFSTATSILKSWSMDLYQ